MGTGYRPDNIHTEILNTPKHFANRRKVLSVFRKQIRLYKPKCNKHKTVQFPATTYRFSAPNVAVRLPVATPTKATRWR